MKNRKYIKKLMLNMQMLMDDLEENYDIKFFLRKNDTRKLLYTAVYYGQKELDEYCVYVAEAEVFRKNPIKDNRICRIICGESGYNLENAEYSVVVMDENTPWMQVFNSILMIFSRYFSFENQLQMILNNGGSLYELCVEARKFFQNPLYIHDPDFNVLAMPSWVVGMSKFDIEEETGKIMVPLKKVEFFHINSDYIRTLNTQGAQMWNPSYNSHRVLYINIWTEEHQYRGRLLINELNTSLKPSDFLMAEFFAEFLSMAMERNMFKSDNSNGFEKILEELYEGQNIENAYVLNRLKMVGWERNHSYRCFLIILKQRDASSVICKRICSTLAITMKHSFSFNKDNMIGTVCNVSLSGYTDQECEEKLQDINAMTQIKVGGSVEFNDFLKIKDYFKQTEKAIQIGMQQNAENYCYWFTDYALDYIITHFEDELGVDVVCSQGVLRLMKIDREKNTEYIQTLKCLFENNCQQTAAAQAMYIHRSTLVYRLEKIEQIAHINLDDPLQRLYIQISIRLLENII